LLALPTIHVIGQRSCPEWMGVDRGIQVSGQMFDAWRKGELPPPEVWAGTAVAEAWKARVAKLRLIDYKLMDSGCWERLSPVTTGKTWHEFRVTVQQGDRDRFSKMVTVYTRATRHGWAGAARLRQHEEIFQVEGRLAQERRVGEEVEGQADGAAVAPADQRVEVRAPAEPVAADGGGGDAALALEPLVAREAADQLADDGCV